MTTSDPTAYDDVFQATETELIIGNLFADNGLGLDGPGSSFSVIAVDGNSDSRPRRRVIE